MKFNQAHPKNNLSNNVGTTVSFDEEYIHRHDIMMQEKNVVYDEEQRQKYTKIAKELSWIDRKENGYFIIVPKTIDDFKCEGKMQHNCVYTLRYYELVIKRQSIIVFSRKEADKPYITIEFDYETFGVLQAYGKYNSKIDSDLYSYIVNLGKRLNYERLTQK